MIAYIDASVLLCLVLGQPRPLREWRTVETGTWRCAVKPCSSCCGGSRSSRSEGPVLPLREAWAENYGNLAFGRETWGQHLALRVASQLWSRPWGESSIVILLRPDGDFHVNYYVPVESPGDQPTITEIDRVLSSDGYRTGLEGVGRVRGFYGDRRTFKDIDALLDFVRDLAGRFQQYFTSIPVTPTRPEPPLR